MIKKHLTTILLVIILLAGLSLLLYPTVSNYINSLHQSQVIAEYDENVAKLSNDEYEKMLKQANSFNKKLSKYSSLGALSGDLLREYYDTLNISGTGIMGYIEIKSINCSLAIYHGTKESVLQIAVGHIEGSSLPVGGKSTHCVLSGHRGLPSAKLFTNLDRLREGNTFVIRTLNEMYTYEVDQILIVLPGETDALAIVPGEDLCTLVTCTPYGINTHRLLVRGHRVENEEDVEEVRVTADAMQIEPMVVAPIVAAPILIFLLILLLGQSSNNKQKSKIKKKLDGKTK